MASTYSPALRLELMATGDQSGTWGNTTNTNLGTLLEQAITGYLSVAQGDVANLTLTTTNGASDQARNAVVEVTGALTATRNVVVQTAEKLYTIKNSTTGGFSIVAKTSGGTGISIPPGASIDCYSDGTNVVAAANYWNGSIGGAVYLDAGAAAGPDFDLFRDSTSPAVSDILGQLIFNGRDSAGNKQEYASIQTVIIDPVSTTEDGSLDLYATVAGTRTLLASVFGTGLALANGTNSLPALSFISDPDSGLYRIGANNVGVAVNGAKVLDVATTGLAVTGTLSSTGNFSVSAGTASISSSAAGALLTVTSTEAGAGQGPIVEIYRDSASPAASDSIGSIIFYGKDSAANKQQYAEISASIVDPTSTSEDSYVIHYITAAGAVQAQLYLGLTAGSAVDPNNIGLVKGQLSFPPTQNPSSDANTLDDYEEGTFTPGLSFGGGTTGLTYLTQVGRYQKIGKYVHYNLYVRIGAKGSSTGVVRITGLPFASDNVSGMQSAQAMWATTLTGISGGVMGLNDPNTTTIQIYYSATGASVAMTDGNVSATAEFSVSGLYAAAA